MWVLGRQPRHMLLVVGLCGCPVLLSAPLQARAPQPPQLPLAPCERQALALSGQGGQVAVPVHADGGDAVGVGCCEAGWWVVRKNMRRESLHERAPPAFLLHACIQALQLQ